MPEESKRRSATTVGDGPFDVKKCDCTATGCTAWHVLSGETLVAVVQNEQVAAQVASALTWAYHPGATHVPH